jgi:hypothetical protein
METNPIRVCVIYDPHGALIKAIPPQYRLDDLYAVSAEYACGIFIPTALAQQAVFDRLYKDGYRVKWHTLAPEDS